MAFLHTAAFRPSCVVSALPRRFRLALEKELSGSVAISSCRVEQLEDAVKLRGATIAVVGASDESLDIAERLSHSPEGVRVFLVHYQDSLAATAMTNGFAGVFDLRMEHDLLAKSIRKEALQPGRSSHSAASSKSDQRWILEHFIAMNERLSQPRLAGEFMLDGFLQVARVQSGALLLPGDSRTGQFQVAACRGRDMSEVGEQVSLSEETVLEMLTGDTLFFPDGLSAVGDFQSSMGSAFHIGVPLVSGKELLGCLIARTNEASDSMADYALVATHLLSQMRHREAEAQHERLISDARQQLLSSWLLADADGRIVHREGEQAKIVCPNPRVRSPRLRHAIAEAHAGQGGSIRHHGFSVSYRPFAGNDCGYALMRIDKEMAPNQPCLHLAPKLEANTLGFIKAQLGDSPEKGAAVEAILESIRSASDEGNAFDLKTLPGLGIELIAGAEQVPADMTGRIALVLLALAKMAEGKVTFSMARLEQQWALTFECEESGLLDGPSDRMTSLATDLLVHLVLRVTGLQSQNPTWQFGVYGGRLEWRTSPL